MSSAQTELQRLLSLPLVDIHSRNALAVLYAQCEAPSVFARFAVEHIARRARSTLHSHVRKLLEGCTCADCGAYAQERPDLGFRRGPRPDIAHELEVPEQAVFESGAVNDEAKRWICDFLLFPLFKRKQATRTWEVVGEWCRETVEVEPRSGLASEWKERRDLQVQVEKRDGPACILTNKATGVHLVQILPLPQDRNRFDRFKELASVFFDHQFDDCLNEQLVKSPANAILLTEEWVDALDEGRMGFQYWHDQRFYALTFDDPTAANLTMARRSHGLGPYPRLEFAYNSTIYQGAGISRCLVWIHAKIVHTWRQTGLSDRFIGDVTWISSLPPLQQRPEALGQNSFAQILTHRLSIC